MSTSWFRGRCEKIGWVMAGVTLVILAVGIQGSLAAQTQATEKLDRTVLPIPEPKMKSITTFDARKATPPARFEIKAPAGAPNVLLVMLDDLGFGMSSAFGGPVHMPTAERLGKGGAPLQPFPYDGPLLADQGLAVERSEPPHEQHGCDHGSLDGVSWKHRPASKQRGAARRDAAAQRLQHGLLRQES